MSSDVFVTSNFEEIPMQSGTPAAVSSQLQVFHIVNPGNIQKPVGGSFHCEADYDIPARGARGSLTGSRKRSKVTLGGPEAASDPNQNYGITTATNSQPTCLSTGLHLTFQDEQLEPLAPCIIGKSNNVPFLSQLTDVLRCQLLQQRDEIDKYIKNQENKVRKNLEEKRLRHSREITAIIENRILITLREKEIEVEKVMTKNLELEKKITNLFQQACAWQSRAKFNEAMMLTLRNNLHQAVTMSKEPRKEEFGDNRQAGDAESSCPDDTADAHAMAFIENKQLKEQRSCKVCRSNDVSVLLLPCRHLCLCKECEASMDSCPLCKSFKTASVQVYLT